jgi:hypothetical protein
MVLRTARRGQHAGREFWGCSAFPDCRGTIAIADAPNRTEAIVPTASAGGSAQAEFVRRKQRRAERLRRAWPLAVGATLILMLSVYLLVQAVVSPAWGAAAAGAVALMMLSTFLEVPQTIDAWRIGADGERRTGRDLQGLADAGFVVLHDRRVPGYGGNVDHIAIGPSGVWAIETKSIAGKVEIHGDSLTIGRRKQDKAVDQVYREATAVQIAMANWLTPLGLTVTPVICLHRGELPWFNKTVRGVRLASGRQLVRLLRDGEARLSADQVQALGREADRLLKSAMK